MQRRLGKVRREKQEAINLQHFERAAELREQEREPQLAWRDAYRAWAGDS